MYLISDHNASDSCGREVSLDIGLDPIESGRRVVCERNDFIIGDTNDDGNARVCKRTEHRLISIINFHVLDAKSLHQVCHHVRLGQVIRRTTIVHSDCSFHCMVQIFCVRRPKHSTHQKIIRRKLTIYSSETDLKHPTKCTYRLRNGSTWGGAKAPKLQCNSSPSKRLVEYEEDPNVQQPV